MTRGGNAWGGSDDSQAAVLEQLGTGTRVLVDPATGGCAYWNPSRPTAGTAFVEA